MSKISQKNIAQQLFQKGKTLVEISAELNVSKTSLLRWKKDGNWDNPHQEDVYKTKISENMHLLASQILEDVTAEYSATKNIDADKFSVFDRLMGRINGAKKYDDETAPAEEKKVISADTIKSIMQELT